MLLLLLLMMIPWANLFHWPPRLPTTNTGTQWSLLDIVVFRETRVIHPHRRRMRPFAHTHTHTVRRVRGRLPLPFFFFPSLPSSILRWAECVIELNSSEKLRGGSSCTAHNYTQVLFCVVTRL